LMRPAADGKSARLERIPTMGPKRVYLLTADILQGAA
jgi:hypothetical protein